MSGVCFHDLVRVKQGGLLGWLVACGEGLNPLGPWGKGPEWELIRHNSIYMLRPGEEPSRSDRGWFIGRCITTIALPVGLAVGFLASEMTALLFPIGIIALIGIAALVIKVAARYLWIKGLPLVSIFSTPPQTQVTKAADADMNFVPLRDRPPVPPLPFLLPSERAKAPPTCSEQEREAIEYCGRENGVEQDDMGWFVMEIVRAFRACPHTGEIHAVGEWSVWSICIDPNGDKTLLFHEQDENGDWWTLPYWLTPRSHREDEESVLPVAPAMSWNADPSLSLNKEAQQGVAQFALARGVAPATMGTFIACVDRAVSNCCCSKDQPVLGLEGLGLSSSWAVVKFVDGSPYLGDNAQAHRVGDVLGRGYTYAWQENTLCLDVSANWVLIPNKSASQEWRVAVRGERALQVAMNRRSEKSNVPENLG